MKVFKIRLRRVGRWKKPVYAVIVTFKTSPTKGGRYFEKLGFYSPASQPKFFFVNFARLAYWLMRGAAMTDTVGTLISRLLPLKR